MKEGVIADIGAYEYAENAASEIDLLVTELVGPAEATVGGSARLTWTVRNDGAVTVNGPWIDKIWLVDNPGDRVGDPAGSALSPGRDRMSRWPRANLLSFRGDPGFPVYGRTAPLESAHQFNWFTF